MKRIWIGFAAFALVGCSSGAATTGALATSTPPAASSTARSTLAETATPTATTLETNKRGLVDKAFGAPSGFGCRNYPAEPCDVEFTISAPISATTCSDENLSENGTVQAFPVTVDTGSEMDPEVFSDIWNPNNFTVVRTSGVTLAKVATSAVYGCKESDQAIPRMLPASKYDGFVVLDMPSDGASLLFTPNSKNGWEYLLG